MCDDSVKSISLPGYSFRGLLSCYVVGHIMQSIFSSASRPLDAGRKKRIIAAATVS